MRKVSTANKILAWLATLIVTAVFVTILILMNAPTWGWFGLIWLYYSQTNSSLVLQMAVGTVDRLEDKDRKRVR